ncbi:PREDICTED: integrator complex subunit 5-like isoform X2 [Priapulus caudatus]|uniref:Integrator complex subunit 5-like isoform X2 n=1 Tax=Priapulus caudatus TaxID=37621 RepID=A0ABM1FB01_PRICU|nr:PREDICTED: integrator complex subunit 5-like isoform X2 [Priapulus caudatus]
MAVLTCPGPRQFLINTMALDTGINEKVEKCCTVILDMLVMDLQRMIGMIATWEATRGDIPFLASLLSNQIALCNMLLQPHPQQGLVWLSRILAFVGQYGGEPVAADILHHFLCHGQDSRMASLFQSMSQEMDSQLPNALQRTVDKAFVTLQSQPDMLETLLCNMLTLLLRWRHRRSSNRFAIILRNHVSPLCCHLRSNNRKVSSAAMQCLHLIGHPRLLPLGTMLQLCFGVTAYFFSVLHIKAVEEKLVGVRTCRAYLQSLSEIPGAQHVLLHSLVHGCMLQGQAGPLRSRIPAPPVEKCKVEQTAMACLLEENAHHGHAIILPQSHSSVFHAGIIGKGVQNPPRAAMFTRNEISTNRQLFLDVVQACSLYHPNDETDTMELDIAMETEQLVTAEPGVAALEAIALMLTEMATPDVLYNQIDWPEEAFARCTVERDLVIKKRFHEYPVLWELLDFVSRDRAALLQCSVLLRGIVAILLAYWENCRDSATTASPWQLEASCRVIQIMNQGKLLPLPLSDISILFPLLSPYETHLLLRDVWQYIHENNISQTGIGPGPMPGCSSCHTDTLRSILQLNTSAVGHLYCHFFNTGKQS